MAPAYTAIGKTPTAEKTDSYSRMSNFKNGKFINTIPAEEPAFFKTLWEWIKGAQHTTPDSPLPVHQSVATELNAFPESGLRITWLGHSTTLIELDGVRILTDPVWSERSSPFSWMGPKRFFDIPLALPDLPALDAVVISHDHYDHLDKPTVLHLAQTGVPLIVPLGVDARLESFGVDPSQVTALNWWEHTDIKGIRITATPARHFSGRGLSDRNRTLWAGFAFAGPQHNVYYTGDTGMCPEFKEIGNRLGPFDATLVEIGAYHRFWADLHLGPEQAVAAVQNARGGLLIPVHWGTFDLALHSWVEPAERLIAAAIECAAPIVVPMPGQSITPSAPPPLKRWWPDVPWQTAAEHPIVASGI